jgi:hypothetical protein
MGLKQNASHFFTGNERSEGSYGYLGHENFPETCSRASAWRSRQLDVPLVNPMNEAKAAVVSHRSPSAARSLRLEFQEVTGSNQIWRSSVKRFDNITHKQGFEDVRLKRV